MTTLIYVVDDEELMLDFAEVALSGFGYSVKKFSDPADAFASFTNEVEKPALLLTDYAMAPFNGLELSERCKAAHPELKIVMLSGTVSEEFARDSKVQLDGFLAKPYQASMLAKTVTDVLTT